MRMTDQAPKTAIELAMERLRQKDATSGADEPPLTPQQKDAIAEARNVHEARMAECRILHESALRAVADPEARAELTDRYRRDAARLATDRDQKIEAVRRGSGA